MRFLSWNVNGLRACVEKGFLDQFRSLDADFFSLQETKMQPGQLGSLTATRLRKCEKALCRLIFLSIFTFCCCSTPGTML